MIVHVMHAMHNYVNVSDLQLKLVVAFSWLIIRCSFACA